MWMPVTLTLETLALILIVLFAVKMLVLLIKPSAWMKVVETVYAKSIVTIIVFAVLAYIALGSLLESGLSYVNIFAIALFVCLLFGLSFAVYSNEAIKMGKSMLKSKNFWKKAWFPVLVWVVLSVLTLNEMYNLF